mmetsp:Transcript_84350/g.176549  ORF Transcript_84350/g.176549 Transcript_84350/m.176549 type:complete len:199 (-) Transcript_84350:105-701(-)|eukprot:CAMPEP_0206432464 /NCGR_PEP_ID=MMETSP0324_2-20121206/7954_1 /ASSEMBLY_ACC=CAM_ASM_000836 /TAXON_ID=2866 /ORGANISM="Crypthecodinium cohnii, Strain Seligo" /LENGTH=198 /DNA_ID=CAMNT_0053898545 /DNA_START=54 /DNA_END=650 /DNA_ORIENTATION=-
MIPMNMPQLQGAPPPEAHGDLIRMKWSVLGLMGFGIGRFLFGMEILNTLSIFLAVVQASFVLKDDPHMIRVYSCLSKSLFQSCAERGMEGLGCLFPFLLFNSINVVMDILLRSVYIFAGLYGMMLLGTIGCGAASSYYAWKVYKVCQDGVSNSMEMESGSNYVQADDNHNNAPNSYAAGGPGSPGFEVFSGSGNRLGG